MGYRKNILIIGAILFLILNVSFVAASYNNDKTTDYWGELKNKDYGEFTMDTPSKIEFKESTGAHDSHVFYTRSAACVYINYKDKTDFNGAYGKILERSYVIYPNTVSNSDFSGKMTFYQIDHHGALHKYYASYENDEYMILIGYDYIDDLVDMTRTIQIDSDTSSFADNTMSIISGIITTGSGLSDKTEASIYVGDEFAGQDVIIQIYYSRDGSLLNNGNMVPKTVTSTGYIDVSSADSYKYYPDNAEINLYDSNNNLLDSKTVDLSPTSGSQYF